MVNTVDETLNDQIQKEALHHADGCKLKWKDLLENEDMPPITDQYRKTVTAVLLENQEQALREAAPTNAMGSSSSTAGAGAIDTLDPVYIAMVRRGTPNLIAFDMVGVQAMTMPTGLIFALRSRYKTQANTEALFNEANTGFSAENAGNTFNFDGQQTGDLPDHTANSTNYTAVSGMATSEAEILGDGTANNEFNEMAFSIEKISVEAKSRALKAEYTIELQQDLKAVHGLNAEAELANILSTEIMAEINREIIRKINISATIGAQQNTANAGRFDLDADANGRWTVEKWKGMLYQIEREANAIAKATRRGKGNVMICSSDLASALSMTGMLDSNPALAAATNLSVDDTGITFVGILSGRIKVFIDPYYSTSSDNQYFTLGYKGASPMDAGIFYAPYVPLQMMRGVGESSFQPKIAFKTRYGLVSNPFATSSADGTITFANKNIYYRRVSVENIL